MSVREEGGREREREMEGEKRKLVREEGERERESFCESTVTGLMSHKVVESSASVP